MAEPEIALVFSAEPWVEQLHRHCSDHGGARVRQLLVDPDLALDEEYETLVVGHRWPALTPALVEELHRHGRSVLGVWDRAEGESRALLLAVGVDGLVAADASAPEIVAAIVGLPRLADARPPAIELGAVPGPRRGIVVGGPAGTGSTEVAIGLARALGDRRNRVVLVDADDHAPAIAPRLALAIEPNLASAVDAVEFHSGALRDTIVRADGFDVIAGVTAPGSWMRLRASEVLRVVDELGREYERVILDVAPPAHRELASEATISGLAAAVMAEASVVVGVASPTPVGITRFIGWLADVLPLARDAELHVVVNRAPAQAFRRGEIQTEIFAAIRPESLTCVPADRRVADAAWAGAMVGRGPFTRATRDLARRLATGPALVGTRR